MGKSYTSDNRLERIHAQKTLVSSSSFSYTHNLGYKPFIQAFVKYPNGKYGSVSNIGPSADVRIEIFPALTTTTISFNVFDNTFGGLESQVEIYVTVYAEART